MPAPPPEFALFVPTERPGTNGPTNILWRGLRLRHTMAMDLRQRSTQQGHRPHHTNPETEVLKCDCLNRFPVRKGQIYIDGKPSEGNWKVARSRSRATQWDSSGTGDWRPEPCRHGVQTLIVTKCGRLRPTAELKENSGKYTNQPCFYGA
jgi:hypothetical protein